MPKIRTLLIVLLACLALIAVACGGDDDDSKDDSTSTTGESVDATDTSAPDVTASGEEGDEGDGEAAPVDGDVFFDLCDGDQSAFAGLGAGAFTAIDPTNPDLEASMKATVAQFNEIAEAAPSEIQADFEVLAEAFAKYDEVMAAIDYNFLALATDPEAAAKMAELETAFDSDELNTASDNITAWTEENCTPAG